MKKFFAALLAAVMLALCACAPGFPPAETGQTEGNPAPEEPPVLTAVVRVTLDQEYALRLDQNRTVIGAAGENGDGEALLAQAQAMGQSYDSGLAALLNAAYGQGRLEDGGRIPVTVELVEGSREDPVWLYSVTTPIARFLKEKNIHSELSVGLYAQQIPEEQTEVEVNGRTLYLCRSQLSVEGEPIGTQIKYSTVKIPDDMVTLSEEIRNSLVKGVSCYSDGSVSVIFWENRDILYDIISRADGTVACYSSGQTRDPMRFDGIPETRQNRDGSTTVYLYYSNGNYKTADTRWPNGDIRQDEYYEDGNTKTVCIRRGGSETRYEYGQNRALLREENYLEDGTYSITTFVPNGRSETVTTVRFHSDGKPVEVVIDGVSYTDAKTLADHTARLDAAG